MRASNEEYALPTQKETNKTSEKSGPGGSNPGPSNCNQGELPAELAGPFV